MWIVRNCPLRKHKPSWLQTQATPTDWMLTKTAQRVITTHHPRNLRQAHLRSLRQRKRRSRRVQQRVPKKTLKKVIRKKALQRRRSSERSCPQPAARHFSFRLAPCFSAQA